MNLGFLENMREANRRHCNAELHFPARVGKRSLTTPRLSGRWGGILKMAGLWAQGVCACTGTHVFMCTTRIVEALRIE